MTDNQAISTPTPDEPGESTASSQTCVICGRPLSHPNGVHCPRTSPVHPEMTRTCYSLYRSQRSTNRNSAGTSVPAVAVPTVVTAGPNSDADVFPAPQGTVSEYELVVRQLRAIHLCNQADVIKVATSAATLLVELNPAALALHKEQVQHEADERVATSQRQLAEVQAKLDSALLRERELELARASDDAESLEAVVAALEEQVTGLRGTIDELRAQAEMVPQQQRDAVAAAVTAAVRQEQAAAAVALAEAQKQWEAQTEHAIADAVERACAQQHARLQQEHELLVEAIRDDAAAAVSSQMTLLRAEHELALGTLRTALEQAHETQRLLISHLPQGVAAGPADPTTSMTQGVSTTSPSGPAPDAAEEIGSVAGAELTTGTSSVDTPGRRGRRPTPRRPFAHEPELDPAQPRGAAVDG